MARKNVIRFGHGVLPKITPIKAYASLTRSIFSQNRSVDNILCRVPANALLNFSYVAEHVTNDIAVAILERIIQSIERVAADGFIEGDWEQRLAWLNEALAEVWDARGPFPGNGSVLQFLAFTRGVEYHKAVLAPMVSKGKNPLAYLRDIFEGRIEPPDDKYRGGLMKARERWGALKSRQELLALLMRFDITPQQLERIASSDQRHAAGITATEEELVNNPYLIAEMDLGTAMSEPIALETIDHGIRPEGHAALFPLDDVIAQDDRRRVRAVAHSVLSDAANDGDTVLPVEVLFERIRKRFPEKRACRTRL